MFAVVILYGITKDRWRWREFMRGVGAVFAAIVIGTVVILILGASHNSSDVDSMRQALLGQRDQQVLNRMVMSDAAREILDCLRLNNRLSSGYLTEEVSTMALSNAEKQRRWQKRNLLSLTWDAREIIRKLETMDDQIKLAQIIAGLNARFNPKDGRCRFVKDDGGRGRSGIARGIRRDETSDCVARAIAIAAQKPYREVHDTLTAATVRHVATASDAWARRARRRGGVRAFHADHGVVDEVYRTYLEDLGWRFTSTKELPRGRGVHLRADELPRGRLIVRLPGHLTAVIDGVIHDTNDCSDDGRCRIQGYWTVQPRGPSFARKRRN